MAKINIFLQARVNSTRVPEKITLDFGGKPLLWHVVFGLKNVSLADELIILTGPKKNNSWIIDFARKYQIQMSFFEGQENDVLSRFYFAAKRFQPDHIVRYCADNVFVSPTELNNLIKIHLKNKNDYTRSSNSFHPDLKAEIFSLAALEKAFAMARTTYEREHVTPYIYETMGEVFKIGVVEPLLRWPKNKYPLAVDKFSDIQQIRMIVTKIFKGNEPISEKQLLQYLKKHES